MSTNFPTSLDSYTAKSDGVDDVLAAHVNNLQDAIVAVETKLCTGGGITLTVADAALGFKVVATSGHFSLVPYVNATAGTAFYAYNPAETGYIPMTLVGSVVYLPACGLHIGSYGDPGEDNLIVDGGLNIGTASGATAGQIRASSGAFLGGVTTHQYAQRIITDLADHGKTQIGLLAEDLAIAFIICSETAGAAIYLLRGAGHTTVELVDSAAGYTVTEDNDNTTNIYWDAGNVQYELNNELGTTTSYYIWLMRYSA